MKCDRYNCGGEMLHNRLRGVFEGTFVEILLECSECDNEEKVMIDPVEEDQKAEAWKPFIERMKYGRARPEPGTEKTLKKKSVDQIESEFEKGDDQRIENPESNLDHSSRKPDDAETSERLDGILGNGDEEVVE